MTAGLAGLWAGLLLVPALHPLLIPLVGVPSHLLWWVHVLPVALATYRGGRRSAAIILPTSLALVVAGERAFGTGYGAPADWQTVGSLGVALTFTNALVAGFAFYARATARRYRLLFERSTVGIVLTDAGGRIASANRAAIEVLHCSTAELLGQNVLRVLHLPDGVSLDQLEHAGGWNGRIPVGCNEEGRPLDMVLVAIRQEEPRGYQILMVDRSVEIAREQELQRKSKLAVLGEGLAGVAHELKNPLTVISGYAEMGSGDEALPSEARELFAEVKDQAGRMNRLIQELLAFSRPLPDEVPVDLARLVERTLRVQRRVLPKHIRVTQEIQAEPRLRQGATKVEQILLNLLSNAADAIGAEPGSIVIRCHEADQAVVLEVVDSGPGIPPEIAARLFQPFVTGKPTGKGTGLGLAISRRLAHSMGGSLEARNHTPHGTVFTLRLPMVPAREPADEADPAAAATPFEPWTGSAA